MHICVAVGLPAEGAPKSVGVVYIVAVLHLNAAAAPAKLTVGSLSAGVVYQLK